LAQTSTTNFRYTNGRNGLWRLTNKRLTEDCYKQDYGTGLDSNRATEVGRSCTKCGPTFGRE